MLRLAGGDDLLRGFVGSSVPSSVYPGVSYALSRSLGAGSMAIAFLAERRSSTGTGVAVLKITRPEFVRQHAETAQLTIQKESVALGRLNERVPPTPFVVRFIENGDTDVQYGQHRLSLPWIAMEYVHGDTLEDRIQRSVQELGSAFDPERAAFAVESIASGLDAVHSVNVIHRDIKPNNVLCCGSVPDEVFKISDFGVARPLGLRQTFMQGSMGTPGYASPEQIMMDEKSIGPASDVFSLAATAYCILTGEELFPGDSVMKILEQIRARTRRSIRDARTLSEELRGRASACTAIDAAISLATAPEARDRPQSAGLFGAMITSALRVDDLAEPPPSRARPDVVVRSSSNWTWKVRYMPGSDRAIRKVAWDAAGNCLAVTTSGLSFWNGTDWSEVPLERAVSLSLRSVSHAGPGRWLVGGERGLLAYYGSAEGLHRLRRPNMPATLDAVSGQPDDLAVAVGSENEVPVLFGISGKRWLRELPMNDLSLLLGLSRFDEERWLVAGRRRSGGAFAGLYSPLRWEIAPIGTLQVRTFTACAGVMEVGVGMVVGAQGAALRVGSSSVEASMVPGGPDLSSVVMEPNQRAWTTSLGRIWMQTPQDPLRWTCTWEDPRWNVPVIGLFSDGRRVIGVSADGAVIEGSEY